MRSTLEILDIPISTAVEGDVGQESHGPEEPPVPVGLETVLGMAAVDPGFSSALLKQPDRALQASGARLVPAERAALRSADAGAIATMVASLRSRLPETERRAFLDWAGRALVVLAAGGVAGCADEKRKEGPLGEAVKEHSRGNAPEAMLEKQHVRQEEPEAPAKEAHPPMVRRNRPDIVGMSSGIRVQIPDTVDQGYEASRMRVAIRSQTRRLRHCYDLARKVDARLKGTVKISFTVSEDGRVSGVKVRSRMGGGLVECIRKRVSGWRFPRLYEARKVGPISLIFSPSNSP